MRSLCCSLLLMVTPMALADDVVQVVAGDSSSLQQQLVAIAKQRLRDEGIVVDEQRAWMSVSRPLANGEYCVRADWREGSVPSLPLAFELTPVKDPSPCPLPVGAREKSRVTLAISLRRNVLTATRRLYKGSQASCDDFVLKPKDLSLVPPAAFPAQCHLDSSSVVLRDLAAGDVLIAGDIGRAPDVFAGTPVRVSVLVNGINVTTTATALTDGSAGDRLDVRLQRSTRTLTTRVTGPGSAQLMESRP